MEQFGAIGENRLEGNEMLDLSILYAEDEKIIRNSVAETLGDRYSRVEVVSNGNELLAKLEEPGASYDCVLTDNNMPGKTGLEVLRFVRRSTNESLKKIPFVVFSATTTEAETKPLNAGLLEKPALTKDIYKAIESAIPARTT